MKVFDGSDKNYIAWLHEHPEGFVLNLRRGKSDTYIVLHRATCGKILSYNEMARPGGFTERNYIKVCASSIELLRKYARTAGRHDGSFSRVCGICNP